MGVIARMEVLQPDWEARLCRMEHDWRRLGFGTEADDASKN
jgi:hypothetical protein